MSGLQERSSGIEQKEIDPITPELFRNRVDEFFSGVDLNEYGSQKNGLLDIEISTGFLVKEISASLNGVLVAEIFDGEPFESSGLGQLKIWKLYGGDGSGNEIIISNLLDDEKVNIERRVIASIDPESGDVIFDREEITDPEERIEIAKRFGILNEDN